MVLCTGNSCRSQMAEGLLRHHADDSFTICSAGVQTHGLNPKAVQVMNEIGIDISGHQSELVENYLGADVELVFSVCDHAKESCPIFPGQVKNVHHNFPDPAKTMGTEEEIIESFRSVRNEIDAYCQSLIKDCY